MTWKYACLNVNELEKDHKKLKLFNKIINKINVDSFYSFPGI